MSKRKKICVIGLGMFGQECSRRLAGECDVLAIDFSQKLVNEIADEVQQARRADARDYESMAALVSKDFDEVIVSVGENLETSILAVLNILNIGIKYIHAKAVNKEHKQILKALERSFSGSSINVIHPEGEAAAWLVRSIIYPNVLENIVLADEFVISEIATPDMFYGKSLGELKLRMEYGVYIIAVHEHLPEKTVFMPGPDFICKPSDSLVMIGKEDNISRIRDLNAKE